MLTRDYGIGRKLHVTGLRKCIDTSFSHAELLNELILLCQTGLDISAYPCG